MVKDLDWYAPNPNGGRTENNVLLIKIENKSKLFDYSWDRLACVFCTIPENTVLKLRGTCRYSFIGKTF